MKISRYQKLNKERSDIAFPTCKNWGLSQWGNALAGEYGEACNIIKKIERAHKPSEEWLQKKKAELGKELADVLTYTCLLASCLGVSLEQVSIEKFNEISDKYHYPVKL